MPTKIKTNSRSQVSNLVSVPAPVGGWNAIDTLADMKPTEALALENWFPQTGYCEIRGGSSSHATGMTGNAKTLMVYNGLSGTNKMFCATTAGVYDVSSAGAVGASVATVTNGKFQWTMFGDGTSEWLIAVNGVDKPLYYNGAAWTAVDGASTPALTGLTTTTLVGVSIFKGRLMFLQNGFMGFWYLAAGAAGGALTKFDLSSIAQRGGYVMAAGSWTLDSGQGPDDRMVFVTSKGEVIIYQGTDPTSASTWALVGIFKTGEPLGRKCIVKQGSDFVVLTRSGAFSLNTIIQSTGSNFAAAVSRKIQSVFNTSAQTYGSNFGWLAVVFPDKNAVLVNVPIAEDGTHEQYVMNTISLSWCKFTGWNAEDFSVFNNELYYCRSTTVIKAWTGTSDQGSNITAYAKAAFNNFGKSSQLKKLKMIRPILLSNGNINYLSGVDIDFANNDIVGNSSATTTSQPLWGSAIWGVSLWGGGLDTDKKWHSLNAWPGYYISGKLKITTNQFTVNWLSFDYLFETGGVL